MPRRLRSEGACHGVQLSDQLDVLGHEVRIVAADPARSPPSSSAFMVLPGERASFTVSDIADESSLEPARVEDVLDAFSIGFDDGRDAVATVASFLRGVNPLTRTCLARDAAGNYLMTGGQIGTDSFRMIAETALKACSATSWLGTSASRWVGMTGDGKGPADGIGGAWWCPGCRGGDRVVVVSRSRG